ncbi:MAG: helix-turn-helix transcriptional regulator [Bacteroidetes bacterium]|nr:helix-turn-helix transcriptional regulator [Bacteroidota bacterium]
MKKNKNIFIPHNTDPLDEILSEISPVEENRVRTRMRIAANIDRLLKERNWNKSTLAKELDKQNSEITKWLSGAHNFTSDTLSDIAMAFGVKLSELMEEYVSPVVYSDFFSVKALTGENRKALTEWSTYIISPHLSPKINPGILQHYVNCSLSDKSFVSDIKETVLKNKSWRLKLGS